MQPAPSAPPAPLGWCSEDLADGNYVPAETTLLGTALCAKHNSERIEATTTAMSDPYFSGF